MVLTREKKVVRQYNLNALYQILTRKQKDFCIEYIKNGWVATKAYLKAFGGTYNSAGVESCRLLKNPKIKQFIDYMRDDLEQICHISKAKQIEEYSKIAYSSFYDLHNTWMKLKDFQALPDDVKASIESIETKSIPTKIGLVKYVKIKMHSKIDALSNIDKLMGYHLPKKVELESNTNISLSGVKIEVVRKALGLEE